MNTLFNLKKGNVTGNVLNLIKPSIPYQNSSIDEVVSVITDKLMATVKKELKGKMAK
jgi:hypothetical protein